MGFITHIGTEEQVRLWDGCTNYYKLDETSGTIAIDSIGAINLNKTTITAVAGKNNNCSQFTSTSSRIAAPSVDNFKFERTNSFSFGFWYKYNGNNGRIFSKSSPSGVGYSLYLYIPTNEIGFSCYGTNGTAMTFKIFNSKLSDSNWHYIVWTYNGTSLVSGNNVYLDGISETLTEGTNNLSASIVSNNYFQLGNLDGYNQCFSGYLDEFAIWNRVLSETEAKMLYSAGNGKFYGTPSLYQNAGQIQGLLSYWKLNSTGGTTAIDSKGGIDGTLVNGSFNAGGKRDYCWYNTTTNNKGITLGNNYNFEYNQSFTLNAWIKLDNVTGADIILAKSNSAAPFNGWEFRVNSGRLEFYLANKYQASPNDIYIGGGTDVLFSTNTWYMVTFTYNGNHLLSGALTYFNALNKSYTWYSKDNLGTNSIVTDAAINFCIGGRESITNSLRGYIDEVGIWNRALSATEIQNLYNSGTGIFY